MSQDRPTVIETQTNDLQAVADVLRSQERFVVVGHENPDGDALGSLLGATLGLRALGKDAVMYLAGSGPMPAEYRFLDLSDVTRELPADIEDRVLLAVDCAN
jgi:phosphoesterase RecJ-like protein